VVHATAAGTFSYSIPLTGGCGTVNATGTITVEHLLVELLQEVQQFVLEPALL
jgi:hypothetical protein